MASIYGYVILLVGLSIMLGMAGVNTSVGGTLNSLTNMSVTSSTPGNVAINNFNFWNVLQTIFLENWVTVLATLGALGVGLALRFGVGETVKLGISTFLTGVLITDFVGVINTALTANGLGTAIYWIIVIIYLPLGAGLVVAMANWIGGGN